MTYLVLVFGLLIMLGGAGLLLKPGAIFGFFEKHGNTTGLYAFSIAIRIVLGAVLILGAPESRFPIALQVLGWLSIYAALALVLIGRVRFRNLIKWALELSPPFKRLAGIVAVLFGGFLVYAVL